jgi:hypothetical protein
MCKAAFTGFAVSHSHSRWGVRLVRFPGGRRGARPAAAGAHDAVSLKVSGYLSGWGRIVVATLPRQTQVCMIVTRSTSWTGSVVS